MDLDPGLCCGFCGVAEQFGDGSQVMRLPTNRPTWHLAGSLAPIVSDEDFRSAIRLAFSRWGQVCDLVAMEIDDPSRATELITVANLGGLGGVLADQQLPHPGMRQLRMRVDRSERWKLFDGAGDGRSIDLIRVLTHELGHFIGFQHLPIAAPAELMEPSYSPRLWTPQPSEARIAAGWFGERKVTVPPVVPPKPQPGPGESKPWATLLGYEIHIPGRAGDVLSIARATKAQRHSKCA